MSLTIRKLEASDYDEWRRLWTLYLEFYKATVPDEVYQTTWQRLLSDDPAEFTGLLAVNEAGEPLGLTHYVFHRHCWTVADICYLQDLYVDEKARGTGAGRALIEAVYDAADAAGGGRVYWMTQDFNETARTLYDRIGELTPFIKYQRKL